MRRAVIALFCFAMGNAGFALAAPEAVDALTKQAAPALSHPPVAQSIWNIGADGAATHLPSLLRCDAKVGNFYKTNISVFDGIGLDVDCSYANDSKSLITLYLTQRNHLDLAAEFAEAKRELLAMQAKAQPLPDALQATFASGLATQHLIYSEHDGAIHSDIWVADLDGWMLEFRATYLADDEKAVLDEMALLTANAVRTAGAHLARCAKAGPPVRSGIKMAFNDADMRKFAMMTALMKSAEGVLTIENPVKNPVPDTEWCVEAAIRDREAPMLFWRGIHPDGSDAQTDRITGATMEVPPTIEIAQDIAVSEAMGKVPAWVAILREGEKGWIFTYYMGRPGIDLLAPLYHDISMHKAEPLLGYGYEDKKITIGMPKDGLP